MLPLIIKNREAAIVASNIFLSCFLSRKSIASSTFCMVRKVKLRSAGIGAVLLQPSLILYLFCFSFILLLL